MTVQDLLPIISDLKDEIMSVDVASLQSRYEESLLDLDSQQAQVVIGVRRCGKSTMCIKRLIESGVEFGYVNFDDERLAQLKTDDLNKVLEAVYIVYGEIKYLFFDEIQNVEAWPLFVNRLLRQKMHIILTGSNAKLLSNELMTHLTGRHNEIDLLPFSFAEYALIKGVDTTSKSTRATSILSKTLLEYMHHGGMPELLYETNPQRYVSSLTDSIINRDIANRFRIHNVTALSNISEYITDNFAQEFVATKTGEKFGISGHTAEKYYSYIKEAFLVQGIRKFSYKSHERIRNEKMYVIDMAFVSNRLNTFSNENLGWRLENVVFLELLRRARMNMENVFYYRDKTFEVDFLRTSGHHVEELIQVSYDMSNPKTRKREITGLLKASEKFHCNNLTIVSFNETDQVQMNGKVVNIVPAHEWMMRK